MKAVPRFDRAFLTLGVFEQDHELFAREASDAVTAPPGPLEAARCLSAVRHRRGDPSSC